MDAEQREEWLQELRAAGAVRDEAAKNYARATATVRGLIHDANNAGVPMTEIAKAAGIGRERAHRLYAKTKRAVV